MASPTVRSLHYPVLPLTEVRSALQALAMHGLFAPDLAAPMAKILRRQAEYASHSSYKGEPVRQAEAMAPGALDLARAINARAAAPAVAPSLDPIAVANAAQEAL